MSSKKYVTRAQLARAITMVEKLTQVSLEHSPDDSIDLMTRKISHASAILVMNHKHPTARGYIAQLTDGYEKEAPVFAFKKALKNADSESMSEREWNQIQNDFVQFITQAHHPGTQE